MKGETRGKAGPGEKFYAAASPGKSFSYVAVVDEVGKVVCQGKNREHPAGLPAALSGLGPELKVAMEAARAWQWASGALAD